MEQTRSEAEIKQQDELERQRWLAAEVKRKEEIKRREAERKAEKRRYNQQYSKLVKSQKAEIKRSVKVEVKEKESNTAKKSAIGIGVLAVMILGGVIWIVSSNSPSNVATNKAVNVIAKTDNEIQFPSSVNKFKCEVRALNTPVYVSAIIDGKKMNLLIPPNTPKLFEAVQILRLAYSKAKADNLQMILNGKIVKLPNEPQNRERNVIELEITKENINQILQIGKVIAF